MEERNRDILESKGAFWARVIFYNIFALIAIVISVRKFGYNPLSGIQGMGDLAGFVALLVFIFTTWRELAMLFYDAWAKRERQQGRQEGLQEGIREAREELRQRFDQVFAGDKDAMKKRDQIFNGATETGQK